MDFIDLAAQQKIIYSRLEERIKKVLAHGKYIMGPEVTELEQKLAEFAGVQHAISCSSGTDALLMALMAYDVGPGDLVLTTPFTFIATAETIALLGATPVFVDIDPDTFNIDPERLESTIKAIREGGATVCPLPRTGTMSSMKLRGIITVDLFGLCADYDRINAIAKKYNLFVIEDGAQSFGALYKGKRACGLTEIGCTSFFPAKPLGGYGDGGAVFTRNGELAGKMKSIRIHGQGKDKYDNVRIGINGRLDTLQAAVLLEKLAIFPDEIEKRNRVAALYNENLKDVVRVPSVPDGYVSVWAQYSVLSDRREELMAALNAKGIPTATYYPTPLHRSGAFKHLGYKEGDFPVTDQYSKQIFSLPMHPYLDGSQIQTISAVMRGHAGA
ncbi:MAG TPA: DegT/DnrJ/EryC1/StrS family aminotransferase [Thermodesulfobacteriota bacterium]|nr:DegT/DnrJ/EryC1/StrS family aminotransferase [Thermodesulfobacteriota bacterium]HNU71726.1 DegT/DnrJ/EryC1/StrS family aminotransferase [Thermodesulfobacteriota bacterium]